MSEPAASRTAAPQGSAHWRAGELARVAAMPLGILALLLIFGFLEPRVLSLANFRNIAVQTSYLAIFAMAQTVVILTRGFDLSLGFTVSLVSVVAAMAMLWVGSGGALAVAAGAVAGLLIAAAIGLGNGVLVAGLGINPLVTTLGMANIVMAFASTISGGFPVTGLPPGYTQWLAQATLLTIAAPIWCALLIYIGLALTLRATKFGRYLYIIGANPRAAVAAGIRTGPVLVLAYVLSSGLTALGAILLTARTGSGEPTLGGNLTLQAIAAAVVGGVRLSGGEGGVGAAILGALFVTVLSNGMNMVQIDGYLQQICLGLIIIASLFIGRDVSRR